jgi:hypothetical protein
MSFRWLFFPARKLKLTVTLSKSINGWATCLRLWKICRACLFTRCKFSQARFNLRDFVQVFTCISQQTYPKRFRELLSIARCSYSARLWVGAISSCSLTRQDKPVLSTDVLGLSKRLALSFSGYSTFFFFLKGGYSTKHPNFKMISLDVQSVRSCSHVTELPRRKFYWDLK